MIATKQLTPTRWYRMRETGCRPIPPIDRHLVLSVIYNGLSCPIWSFVVAFIWKTKTKLAPWTPLCRRRVTQNLSIYLRIDTELFIHILSTTRHGILPLLRCYGIITYNTCKPQWMTILKPSPDTICQLLGRAVVLTTDVTAVKLKAFRTPWAVVDVVGRTPESGTFIMHRSPFESIIDDMLSDLRWSVAARDSRDVVYLQHSSVHKLMTAIKRLRKIYLPPLALTGIPALRV